MHYDLDGVSCLEMVLKTLKMSKYNLFLVNYVSMLTVKGNSCGNSCMECVFYANLQFCVK